MDKLPGNVDDEPALVNTERRGRGSASSAPLLAYPFPQYGAVDAPRLCDAEGGDDRPDHVQYRSQLWDSAPLVHDFVVRRRARPAPDCISQFLAHRRLSGLD